MTLKSVVLPAPFGPMIPRRSPRRTSRLTSRTAVRPPKRFVTRSSVSTDPPGPQATGDTGQALGGEPHDEDEGRGGVLVHADAGELVADPRGLEPDLHAVVGQRDDEGHVDPRDVAEAERPEAGAEGDRDPLRTRREAAPAARDDQEHLRERDRGEREVGAAEAIREVADHPA